MKITLCGAFGEHVRKLCTMVPIRWLTDCFIVFLQDELDTSYHHIYKMGGNKSSRTYGEANANPSPNSNLNPTPNPNKDVDPNRCYLLCNTAGQNCKKECEMTSSGTTVDPVLTPVLPYTTTGWPAASGNNSSPVGEGFRLRSANFIRGRQGYPNAVTLRRVTDMQNPSVCHMEAYNIGGNVFWNNIPPTDIGNKYHKVCEDGTGIPFLVPKGSSHCQDQTLPG